MCDRDAVKLRKSQVMQINKNDINMTIIIFIFISLMTQTPLLLREFNFPWPPNFSTHQNWKRWTRPKLLNNKGDTKTLN